MWGYFNNRSLPIAKEIYNKMLDKSVARDYNQNNQKGLDQHFLTGKPCLFMVSYTIMVKLIF